MSNLERKVLMERIMKPFSDLVGSVDGDPIEICQEFADSYTQQNISALIFGAALSRLPYPEETIKNAIKQSLILMYLDKKMKLAERDKWTNWLDVGYLMLADFLPDVDASIPEKVAKEMDAGKSINDIPKNEFDIVMEASRYTQNRYIKLKEELHYFKDATLTRIKKANFT